MQVFFGVQLQRQQAGKGLHRGLDGAAFELGRLGIERTNSAEKTAVGAKHRDRDVAFEMIDFWRVMVVVERVFTHVVDDDRLMRAQGFKAQGADQIQLAAWLESKPQIVQHCARCPTGGRDARDCGKTHPGHFADDLQNSWNCTDAIDRRDVSFYALRHGSGSRVVGMGAILARTPLRGT